MTRTSTRSCWAWAQPPFTPTSPFQSINQQQETGALEGEPIELRKNYRRGIRKGLLKILSKMGICTMASYRGSQLFEAVGLAIGSGGAVLSQGGVQDRRRRVRRNRSRCPGMSPAGLDRADQASLRDGIYRYMHGGEQHAYNPDVVMQLQQAVASGDWSDYRKFADSGQQAPTLAIRDLLALKPSDKPLPLSKVEKESSIFPRFDTAAMSIGALSPEAHESLAIAMNRLGGRSNSGEGGEDPGPIQKRTEFTYQAGGIRPLRCQRPLPGECRRIADQDRPGRQARRRRDSCPAHKVSVEIATLRCSTPGVTLISPPPHHDIYSIEDLSQLIFDLKMVNPKALVSVKLVAGSGVGTIAVGVAKAYADLITIAGFDGGTGASPLSSVKYAGLPWELGWRKRTRHWSRTACATRFACRWTVA